MAALRAEFHEAGRIAAHYGPRHFVELAALSAAALFVAGLSAVAFGMGGV